MSEILEGVYSDGPIRFHIAAHDEHGRRVDVDYADLFDLILDKLGGSPCDGGETAAVTAYDPPVVAKSGRSFDFGGHRVRLERSGHDPNDNVPAVVEFIVDAINKALAS